MSKTFPILAFALCAMVFVLRYSAAAQQPKKMAQIGFLSARSGPFPALLAFQEGLRDFGWVPGQQFKS